VGSIPSARAKIIWKNILSFEKIMSPLIYQNQTMQIRVVIEMDNMGCAGEIKRSGDLLLS
jgi:hypothetical protein